MQTRTHTEEVVIRQGDRRMTARATVAGDSVTGARNWWTITYRISDPGVAFDDDQPLEVMFAGGHSGRFMPWRKIGRARLGLGMGPLHLDVAGLIPAAYESVVPSR